MAIGHERTLRAEVLKADGVTFGYLVLDKLFDLSLYLNRVGVGSRAHEDDFFSVLGLLPGEEVVLVASKGLCQLLGSHEAMDVASDGLDVEGVIVDRRDFHTEPP